MHTAFFYVGNPPLHVTAFLSLVNKYHVFLAVSLNCLCGAKYRNASLRGHCYAWHRVDLSCFIRWTARTNLSSFVLTAKITLPSSFSDSTIYGFSGTFHRRFPYHLSSFRKCRKFGSNGKRPRLVRNNNPADFLWMLTRKEHALGTRGRYSRQIGYLINLAILQKRYNMASL